MRTKVEPGDEVNMPATKPWPNDRDPYGINPLVLIIDKRHTATVRSGQVRLWWRRFVEFVSRSEGWYYSHK